ncbi:hypothetical protein [Deinococcus kurensis]|uniref:hypothetical protein n=1 Tax=Deinococcus kurensis TaxID=2662757 RepID=UPI0012D367BC|nr:hypothetical protein [Deinococcus kurensis]
MTSADLDALLTQVQDACAADPASAYRFTWAAMTGVDRALAAQREQQARTQQALLAALSLGEGGRLDPQVRAQLHGVVLDGLNAPAERNGIEAAFADRAQAADVDAARRQDLERALLGHVPTDRLDALLNQFRQRGTVQIPPARGAGA